MLYLFNLVDFDEKGNVCSTDLCDLKTAQQNFLYLVSKYNQNALKEGNMSVPSFFKQDLQNVLKMPYTYARKEVFANCLPEVEKLSDLSDRDVILNLCEKTKIVDKKFSEKVNGKLGRAVNNIQAGYILTQFASQKFDAINSSIEGGFETPEEKSRLFKDVITYNSLVHLAENIGTKTSSYSQTASMSH